MQKGEGHDLGEKNHRKKTRDLSACLHCKRKEKEGQ